MRKKKQEWMEEEKNSVRMCFGTYGSKEEKFCNEDCQACSEFKNYKETLFCKKKKTYPCEIMCKNASKCRKLYWDWWYKNKKEYCSLKEQIEKFMEENNLHFEKRREIQEEK